MLHEPSAYSELNSRPYRNDQCGDIESSKYPVFMDDIAPKCRSVDSSLVGENVPHAKVLSEKIPAAAWQKGEAFERAL